MRKPGPLEIAVTAKVAELIQNGEVGIDYRDSDDCEIVWNLAALQEVIAIVYALDKELILANWIDDLIYRVAKPCDLLVDHPDYDRAKAEAEANSYMPEEMYGNPAYDLVAADRRRA